MLINGGIVRIGLPKEDMMWMMIIENATRRDSVRNMDIRNKLKVESLEEIMKRKMLQWF